MSTPAMSLPLLGLAEELSAVAVPLQDPNTEISLRPLLNRLVDAIVDVTQGRAVLSCPDLPAPSLPPSEPPSAERTVDRAACSALAVSCQRLASLLAPQEGQVLASSVARCLRTLGEGLQRLVQDVPDQPPEVARQRFRRAVRRASAQLDEAAP